MAMLLEQPGSTAQSTRWRRLQSIPIDNLTVSADRRTMERWVTGPAPGGCSTRGPSGSMRRPSGGSWRLGPRCCDARWRAAVVPANPASPAARHVSRGDDRSETGSLARGQSAWWVGGAPAVPVRFGCVPQAWWQGRCDHSGVSPVCALLLPVHRTRFRTIWCASSTTRIRMRTGYSRRA